MQAALTAGALALLVALSCQRSSPDRQRARATPPGASLSAWLAPSRAGKVGCQGDTCVQPYPLLPDSGEWRCADEDGAGICSELAR